MEYALEVLPELTHLWLCDSDVIPDDDVLAKLLDADLPVVAAVVRNSPAEGVYNFWCGWRPPYAAGGLGGLKHPYRDGSESSKLLLSEPFVCSLVGACCLIRRDVIDSGVRYGFHEQGEDLFWSLEAQRNGFLLATHPEARTTHFMTKGAEGLR
jgi:GT2 family glycosyltransferase